MTKSRYKSQHLTAGEYDIVVDFKPGDVVSTNDLAIFERAALVDQYHLPIPAENLSITQLNIYRNGKALSNEEEKQFWRDLSNDPRCYSPEQHLKSSAHYTNQMRSIEDELIHRVFLVNNIIRHQAPTHGPQQYLAAKRERKKPLATKKTLDNAIRGARATIIYTKAKACIGSQEYLSKLNSALQAASLSSSCIDSFHYKHSKREDHHSLAIRADTGFAIVDTTAKYYVSQCVIKPIVTNAAVRIAASFGTRILTAEYQVAIFAGTTLIQTLGWGQVRSQTTDPFFSLFEDYFFPNKTTTALTHYLENQDNIPVTSFKLAFHNIENDFKPSNNTPIYHFSLFSPQKCPDVTKYNSDWRFFTEEPTDPNRVTVGFSLAKIDPARGIYLAPALAISIPLELNPIVLIGTFSLVVGYGIYHYLKDWRDDDQHRLTSLRSKIECNRIKESKADLNYLIKHGKTKEAKIAAHKVGVQLAATEKNTDAIISHLEAIRSLGDPDPAIDRNLGLIYATRQLHDKAREALLRYIIKQPADFQAKIDCANVTLSANSQNQSYQRQAEQHFLEILRDCKDIAILSQAHIGKAEIHLLKNQLIEAKKHLTCAIALDETQYSVIRRLGHINLAIGSRNSLVEANANFNDCHTKNPHDDNNKVDLALSYYLIRDQSKAQSILKEMKSRPSERRDSAEAWLNKTNTTSLTFAAIDIADYFTYQYAYNMLTTDPSQNKRRMAGLYCGAHIIAKNFYFERKVEIINKLQNEFMSLLTTEQGNSNPSSHQTSNLAGKNLEWKAQALKGLYWINNAAIAIDILHHMSPDNHFLKSLNENTSYIHSAYTGYLCYDGFMQWYTPQDPSEVIGLSTQSIPGLLLAQSCNISLRYINSMLNHYIQTLINDGKQLPESRMLCSAQTMLNIGGNPLLGLAISIAISYPNLLMSLYSVGDSALTAYQSAWWLPKAGILLATAAAVCVATYEIKSAYDQNYTANQLQNALTHFKNNRHDEALAKTKEILDWDPKHPEAAQLRDIILSTTATEGNNPTSVVELLSPHLERKPNDEYMLMLRRQAHTKLNNTDQATKDHLALRALKSDKAKIDLEFACLLELHGSKDLAEHYFHLALSTAKNEMVQLQHSNGTSDTTIKTNLDNAKEKFDHCVSMIRLRIRHLARESGVDQAISACQTLITEHPDNKDFQNDHLYYQCHGYNQDGQYDKVIAKMGELPDDDIPPELRLTHAQALLGLIHHDDLARANENEKRIAAELEPIETTESEKSVHAARLSKAKALILKNISHENERFRDYEARRLLSIIFISQKKLRQALEADQETLSFLKDEKASTGQENSEQRLSTISVLEDEFANRATAITAEMSHIVQSIKESISNHYASILTHKKATLAEISKSIASLQEFVTQSCNGHKAALFQQVKESAGDIFYYNKPDSIDMIEVCITQALTIEAPPQSGPANTTEKMSISAFIQMHRKSIQTHLTTLQALATNPAKVTLDATLSLNQNLTTLKELLTDSQILELKDYHEKMKPSIQDEIKGNVTELCATLSKMLNDIDALEKSVPLLKQAMAQELSDLLDKAIDKNTTEAWLQHFSEYAGILLSQGMLYLFDSFHQWRHSTSTADQLTLFDNLSQLRETYFKNPVKLRCVEPTHLGYKQSGAIGFWKSTESKTKSIVGKQSAVRSINLTLLKRGLP